MKQFVIQKTKYLLNSSWIGPLLPAGLHQLVEQAERSRTAGSAATSFRNHPAESRISRSPGSHLRP